MPDRGEGKRRYPMGQAEIPQEGRWLETASQHMSSRVPVAAPATLAREIRESLVGQSFDTVAAVAVCADGLLLGVIRNEDLIVARDDARASELMDDSPPVVVPGADQEAAAWKAAQHGEAILAVVDDTGRFRGFVPPHRLLAILLHEHDEDMARFGGYLHDASAARTASLESLSRRYKHRLPWLLIGLAGAFLSAGIVGSFEKQLEANVVIAFFIPGIVYMADAVGTQTETLMVRGLSVGVSIRDVLQRELLTGLFVGITLSLLFIPVALWRWRDSELAIAIALALLAACSIATLVALILPWAFHRLGRDPAFGSGPLATVVQDLLSMLIYFAIVLLITD
jgi:magnesium transporter